MSRTTRRTRRRPAVDAPELSSSATHSPTTDPPTDQRSRAQLWFAAVKPPMYTVAITPITVGTAAAYADTATFHAHTLILFLLAAILIIAWLNITNDVFDHATGIDEHKRESVINLLGGTARARNALLVFACGLLVVAAVAIAKLSRPYPTVPFLLGIAVAGGYAYQGPPFRLGYLGLGEPICFVAWAISVAAAYFAQLSHHVAHLPPLALLPSLAFLRKQFVSAHSSLAAAMLLVAAPTTVILFCSHFHQLHDDRQAGKQSPIVRLGTARAARVLTIALVSLFALHVLLLVCGILPIRAFGLSLLSAPLARNLNSFVVRYHGVPDVVRVAKFHAVRFHFVHGMLLTVGLCLSAPNNVGLE